MDGTALKAAGRPLVVVALLAGMMGWMVRVAPPAHAAAVGKVAPAAVPLGAGVVIGGAGLDQTNRVTFLGGPGPGDDAVAEHFIVVDAKKVVVQVPAGAVSGPIAVRDPSGTVSSDPVKGVVTVVRPPSITSVSARSAQPGDLLSISGDHLFGSKKPKVMFGTKATSASTDSTASLLKVKVPSGLLGGPVTLSVVTDGGRADTSLYIAPAVKGIAAKAGSTTGGAVVTITGSGFRGVDAFEDDPATLDVDERFDGVTIGGERVTDLVAVSDAEIIARTPAGSDIAAPVTVRTTRGDITAASGTATVFEYQPIPTVTGISQNWNAIAPAEPEPVTFTGVNLSRATTVKFGAVVVTDFTVDEAAGTLTLTPPAAVKAAVVPVAFTNLNALGKAFTATVQFAYVTTPTVSKLDPVSGQQGRVVTVTGSGFGVGSTVKFGDEAADCTIISFVQARCVAPAGVAVVDVTVENGAGVSPAVPASAFTYQPGFAAPLPPPLPPSVTAAALQPAFGTTGSTVVVTGSNFGQVTGVEFTGPDGSWVDAENYLVATPGKLAVTVPAGAESGPLRLSTSGDPVITEREFTATVRPTITSIDVVGEATYGAAGGDLLVIKGSGLSVGTPKTMVTIGGKTAPVMRRPEPTSKTIVVQVPASVGGRERVVLSTPLGAATAEADVYFVPQIKTRKPVTYSRLGGTVVTIVGSGFTGAGDVTAGLGRLSGVTFRGIAVSKLVVLSDKEIVAVTAPGSASSDRVLVTSQHGDWTGSSNDVVRGGNLPTPTVTGVTPNTGVIGAPAAPVTVIGTHLRADSVVRFAGTPATVQSVAPDGTSLVVVPPSRTQAGPVTVTVTNVILGEEVTATLAAGYSYLPTPSITGISPSTGFTGSVPAAVTITGGNLRPDSVVRFGATTAAVQSAATNGTSMVVVPPLSNDVGAVDVSVTNILNGDRLTATAPAGYSYQLARATLTGKNTNSARAGTQVTLTGTSFVDVTEVRFGTISASFTVANSTTIFATVPLTPTGQQGAAVDITVVNGTGQPSTSVPATADDWIWDSHPIVTGMSSSTGAQGSTVTISGAGFTGATAVRFGSIDAVSYTVVNDTTVQAVVPTSPSAGAVADVSVVARGLTSPEPVIAAANDWTWAPIAVITSVLPNPGSAGSTITVTGRNFNGIRLVTVNGTDVTSTVVVNSATSLTFVAPPRPGGGGANRVDKPVLITNSSGALSTAEIDPATGKAANLFSWL